MIQWEYRKLNAYHHPIDQASLNKLGIEGWELIAIHDASYWFKRPLEETL